jgi:hypothetical protein
MLCCLDLVTSFQSTCGYISEDLNFHIFILYKICFLIMTHVTAEKCVIPFDGTLYLSPRGCRPLKRSLTLDLEPGARTI